MFSTAEIFLVSFAYILLLFVIAYLGDKFASGYIQRFRPFILSFCLAIYFTAWTYYGTVSQAITKGWYVPPTLIGSFVVVAFGAFVIKKMIAASKRHNSTSIADLIASHYGKSQPIAILVSIVTIFALLPYLSLQLKAVSISFDVLTQSPLHVSHGSDNPPIWKDTTFYVALMMVAFAIMFGTRHISTREHHNGLMLAVAFESVVKLFAFCVIGFFAAYQLHDGMSDLLVTAMSDPRIQAQMDGQNSSGYLAAITLGMGMMFCLPHLFHVLAVESNEPKDADTAQWIFPIYILVLVFFTIPIVLASMLFLDGNYENTEIVPLSMTVASGNIGLSMLVYIGGLSAATSMVLVATITLATMICNDIVMPTLLRFRLGRIHQRQDITQVLLLIRRIVIVAVLLGAYLYYRFLGSSSDLGAVGLLSLALVAQLVPAMIGALYWPGGNRQGVYAGLSAGSILWGYTLLLPTVIRSGWLGETVLQDGLFGLSALRPEALFGLITDDPLSNGVFWSLVANLVFFVGVSLFVGRPFPAYEKELDDSRNDLSEATLERLAARFIGEDQARLAVVRYTKRKNAQATTHSLSEYVETLLAGFVGAASARRVLDLARYEDGPATHYSDTVITEASHVMQFNRELLQASINNVQQGISVADKNLRLVAWNAKYLEMFVYPEGLVHIGTKVESLVRYNASRGECGPGPVEDHVNKRLAYMRKGSAYTYERNRLDGSVLKIQGSPMPGGFYVTTYTDITEYRQMVAELQKINETLEQRVELRTRELSERNQQLKAAKLEADAANQSKTRFLAAASHDLVQPLNASRLFLTALRERNMQEDQRALLDHLANSQQTAEALIHELLEIAKIDAGAVTPKCETFPINTLLNSLARDYEALTSDKGLGFTKVACGQLVYSDTTLLRRILQNLLANALRYTAKGKILLGCRRHGDRLAIEVWDTGCGIPESQHSHIFSEFRQLDTNKQSEGLGLGLATVQRLCRLLDHEVQVQSELGKGSVFRIFVPIKSSENGQPNASPSPAKKAVGLLSGCRVLCLDNDPAILEGMRALLINWDCTIYCCRSEQEVNELITQGITPDIILADYHLDNGVTGIEVVQNFFESQQTNTPCIIISADRTDMVKLEAEKLGLLFLQKPLKTAALRAGLSRLWSKLQHERAKKP